MQCRSMNMQILCFTGWSYSNVQPGKKFDVSLATKFDNVTTLSGCKERCTKPSCPALVYVPTQQQCYTVNSSVSVSPPSEYNASSAHYPIYMESAVGNEPILCTFITFVLFPFIPNMQPSHETLKGKRVVFRNWRRVGGIRKCEVRKKVTKGGRWEERLNKKNMQVFYF